MAEIYPKGTVNAVQFLCDSRGVIDKNSVPFLNPAARDIFIAFHQPVQTANADAVVNASNREIADGNGVTGAIWDQCRLFYYRCTDTTLKNRTKTMVVDLDTKIAKDRLQTAGIVIPNPVEDADGTITEIVYRNGGEILTNACNTIVSKYGTGTQKRVGAGTSWTTSSYGLPYAKYIIHSIGPIVNSKALPTPRDTQLLRSAYTTAFNQAATYGASTVAVPAISTGIYGYPPEQGIEVGIKAFLDWKNNNPTQKLQVICCTFQNQTSDNSELYIDAISKLIQPPRVVYPFLVPCHEKT